VRWLRRRITELEAAQQATIQQNYAILAENRLWKMLVHGPLPQGSTSMVGTDAYAVLGVTREAPAEVIDAAYKALAKKYHPDRAGGSLEMMQRLNQAHDEISGTNGRG
jgi:DnaJ-domain-containing protein 1